MRGFLGGPGGQIFGLICMSVGAGASTMTAFQAFLWGKGAWPMYAGLTVLFCVVIAMNAVRLRKTIP
jgi:hypothetical protein